jgi:hypothetical protein
MPWTLSTTKIISRSGTFSSQALLPDVFIMEFYPYSPDAYPPAVFSHTSFDFTGIRSVAEYGAIAPAVLSQLEMYASYHRDIAEFVATTWGSSVSSCNISARSGNAFGRAFLPPWSL